MPQLNKGDTFADGQQVTGTRLNNLIDGATLLVGAIADQPSLTANTLESTDGLIVNDAGALKKATIGDILNSELDAKLDVATIATIKSGHVEGVLGSDVNLIPLDGTTVTGKTFTSVDGITAIVTSVAHGLVTNMLLTFTASNAVYNGTYLITVLTVDTFSYVITQTTPVAASGTLSYLKKGSVNVDGNVYISDELNVDGRTNLDSLNVSGAFTSSGTANFTGTLQVNGTVGYVLTEIYEHTIPTYIAAVGGQANNIYTSPQFTKPVGEVWVLEMQATHTGIGGYVYEFAVRYGSQTPTTGSYIGYERFHDGSGGGAHCAKMYLNRWVFDTSATFTNETIRVDCSVGTGSEFQFAPTVWGYGGFVSSVMATPSKFRIYKYKTA